jgi:hypothetical protein
MAAFLKEHAQIDAVLSANDSMALGVLQALNEAGRTATVIGAAQQTRFAKNHFSARAAEIHSENTANPALQCRSKKVSAQSLRKTGILPVWAGDFQQFLAIVALFQSLETPLIMFKSANSAGLSAIRCKLS